MRDVVIVSAARTAVGSFGGGLKDIPAVELGKIAVMEALKRGGVKPELVEEVILGCVLTAGQGQNPTRQVLIRAGIPKEIPGTTINKVCASGLKSVMMAAQAIKAGDADIIVAGGTESMSQAPYLLTGARWGYRMNDGPVVDGMIHDGLMDIFNRYHMGITAENVAEKFGVTRQDQDDLAFRSQQNAGRAIKEGRFKDEIVPVSIPQKKGTPLFLTRMNTPAPILQGRPWPVCVRRSKKTGRLRPATLRGSTTAPPPWWSCPRKRPNPWASSRWRESNPMPRPGWPRRSWAPAPCLPARRP